MPYTTAVQKWIGSLFLLLILGQVYGQEVVVKLNDSSLHVGNNFSIEYIINADANLIESTLMFKDLELVEAPIKQKFSTILNGRKETTCKYKVLLKPLKSGSINIKPLSFKVGDKIIVSKLVNIAVQTALVKSNKTTAFIKVKYSRDSIFKGQTLLVEQFLYHQGIVKDFSIAKEPQFAGFWVNEVSRYNEKSKNEIVQINGTEYHKILLRKDILIANELTEGTITPIVVDLTTDLSNGSVLLASENDIVKQRLSLPLYEIPFAHIDFTPNKFVGNFKLDDSFNLVSSEINNTFEYFVGVIGSGNLKFVKPSVASYDSSFYSIKYISKIEKFTYENDLEGSVIFNYRITPKKTGKCASPVFALAFLHSDSLKNTIEFTKSKIWNINFLPEKINSETLNAEQSINYTKYILLGLLAIFVFYLLRFLTRVFLEYNHAQRVYRKLHKSPQSHEELKQKLHKLLQNPLSLNKNGVIEIYIYFKKLVCLKTKFSSVTLTFDQLHNCGLFKHYPEETLNTIEDFYRNLEQSIYSNDMKKFGTYLQQNKETIHAMIVAM